MIIEILIVGSIIVALMIYTSTRIKRSAARAFDEELIDKDDFTLIKPEGFLHVLNDDSGRAFTAYSREFGKDEASDQRRAWIKLQKTVDSVQDVRRAIKAAAESLAEDVEAKVIEVERAEAGRPVNAFYKFASRGGTLYELQAVVLREHRDEFLRKIQRSFESFRLK
jgi:hypothetical protein